MTLGGQESTIVHIIQLSRRIYQTMHIQCLFKQVKVAINCFFINCIHTNVGSCITMTKGQLQLLLHETTPPAISDLFINL